MPDGPAEVLCRSLQTRFDIVHLACNPISIHCKSQLCRPVLDRSVLGEPERRLRRMANQSWTALVFVSVALVLAGSSNAQPTSTCLIYGPTYIQDNCYNYLYGLTMSPTSFCCTEVNFVTTTYGSGCLCSIVLQQAYMGAAFQQRIYSLAAACGVNADMSNCVARSTPAPPSNGNNGNNYSFDVPTPSKKTKVSKGAAVGGGVGGVGLLAAIVGFITWCMGGCRRRPIATPTITKAETGQSPLQAQPATTYASPYPAAHAAPYKAAPYQAAPYQVTPYKAAPYQAAPYKVAPHPTIQRTHV